MQPDMNWDDLKIFLAVSRATRLDKAADALKQDPTTVSRRLRRLEQELGLTLFERTRRGHALTPAGEKLAARVEAMESLSQDIISEGTSENSAAGRVRLGVTEGLGSTVIAPALVAFRHANPNIDVDLVALSGFVSVPKREADMSILLTRPAAGPMKIRKLSDYTLKLYGSEDYLGRFPPVTLRSDLQSHTLVGYVNDLIYSSQLRYFDELLPGLTPHLSSSSIVAQLEMVRAGAGLGILPEFMAKRSPGLVNLLPHDIRVERSFWLAIHEDVHELKRIRLMSEFLVEATRGLA